MPKIIEDARETILASGREILLKEGYSDFSIRALAKRSGIGTGTIYNYFENKINIIANIIIKDWNAMSMDIHEALSSVTSVEEGTRVIYDGLLKFSDLYLGFWNEYSKHNQADDLVRKNHRIVIDSINSFLDTLFERFGISEDRSIKSILSEVILSASVYRTIEYGNIGALIKRLFER